MIDKTSKIIGCLLAVIFLVGLSTTLTRSTMIGFLDVIPVYIVMILAISMRYMILKSKAVVVPNSIVCLID